MLEGIVRLTLTAIIRNNRLLQECANSIPDVCNMRVRLSCCTIGVHLRSEPLQFRPDYCSLTIRVYSGHRQFNPSGIPLYEIAVTTRAPLLTSSTLHIRTINLIQLIIH